MNKIENQKSAFVSGILAAAHALASREELAGLGGRAVRSAVGKALKDKHSKVLSSAIAAVLVCDEADELVSAYADGIQGNLVIPS
jgi:hypothetical protein